MCFGGKVNRPNKTEITQRIIDSQQRWAQLIEFCNIIGQNYSKAYRNMGLRSPFFTFPFWCGQIKFKSCQRLLLNERRWSTSIVTSWIVWPALTLVSPWTARQSEAATIQNTCCKLGTMSRYACAAASAETRESWRAACVSVYPTGALGKQGQVRPPLRVSVMAARPLRGHRGSNRA